MFHSTDWKLYMEKKNKKILTIRNSESINIVKVNYYKLYVHAGTYYTNMYLN